MICCVLDIETETVIEEAEIEIGITEDVTGDDGDMGMMKMIQGPGGVGVGHRLLLLYL